MKKFICLCLIALLICDASAFPKKKKGKKGKKNSVLGDVAGILDTTIAEIVPVPFEGGSTEAVVDGVEGPVAPAVLGAVQDEAVKVNNAFVESKFI